MAENRYLDVYEQYHDRVQDFIGKKIRNEPAAEDMTQDIFLLVYRKWNELADHPNIAGYMMSAAKFHIYKWYDRQRRLVPEEEEILMLLSNGRSRESETDAFRMADFYLFAERYQCFEILLHVRLHSGGDGPEARDQRLLF